MKGTFLMLVLSSVLCSLALAEAQSAQSTQTINGAPVGAETNNCASGKRSSAESADATKDANKAKKAARRMDKTEVERSLSAEEREWEKAVHNQ